MNIYLDSKQIDTEWVNTDESASIKTFHTALKSQAEELQTQTEKENSVNFQKTNLESTKCNDENILFCNSTVFFTLYTRNNTNGIVINNCDKRCFQLGGYDRYKHRVIIVHGYKGSNTSDFSVLLKNGK